MAIRNPGFLIFSLLFSACGMLEHAHSNPSLLKQPSITNAFPITVDLGKQKDRIGLIEQLANKRVIFIGEVHGQPGHHQNQLRVIQNLYDQNRDLVIGLEYFQQSFQSYLDDFIAGKLDEREMLSKTEYFDRWKVDYRLLQPIFNFARDKHIPLLALNVPQEIHNKVFRSGMKSLTLVELAQTPNYIQPANDHYRQHLRKIFDFHPPKTDFKYFVEGVLLWDETMADMSARYLESHPQSRMVVLAGMSHVMYGDGIPERVNRRLGNNQSAVVVNGNNFGNYPGIADYQLATDDGIKLPKAGKLGVSVAEVSDYVHIADVYSGSAAEAAGLIVGDRIVSLNGMFVTNILELKSIMFDKQPGDRAQLVVLRDQSTDSSIELHFVVELR